MGVNAILLLPPDTPVRHVAHAIGALCGLPKSKMDLSCNEAWAIRTDVSVRSNDAVPECVDIVIPPNDIIGPCSLLFHYEFKQGRRGIMPRSRASAIALCDKLAQFFGGAVDFNDCDDHMDRFYERPMYRLANDPEDGEPWQRMHQALYDLEKIAEEEIQSFESVAAYSRVR